MADERTYGFNRDDAQSLIQSISSGESIFPEIRPRGGGGGGGVLTIQFGIIEPIYCVECTVTGYILSRPPGYSGLLPGESAYGTVLVEDFIGCFFKRPNLDLIGKRGYATLLESPDPDYLEHGFVTSACTAETGGIHWHVHSLCCDDPRECS